jgi:hypothetical protein
MNEFESLTIIKALADGSRLKALNSIIRKPQYVEELSERMGLSASTVSFHLKKLEEAGLVSKSRDQYYAVYKADERILDKTLRELITFENVEAGREEERIRQYRAKVVRSFFKDNRLIRFPAQYKKQQIVLEEIAGLFETGRKYQEKELNMIILNVYGDYCTVRRLMIGEGLMERKDNVYWRTGGAEVTGGAEEPAKTEPAGASCETAKEPEKPKAGKGGKMKTREELKREYKEMEMTREMGVIAIRCLRNGRMWLGASYNPEATLRRHRFGLELGGNRFKGFQEDWNEFGAEAFSFEILDTVKPDPAKDKVEELAELETLWREKLADELRNEYK